MESSRECSIACALRESRRLSSGWTRGKRLLCRLNERARRALRFGDMAPAPIK
jgi:hypothetical protein